MPLPTSLLEPLHSTSHCRCGLDIPGLYHVPLEYGMVIGLAFKMCPDCTPKHLPLEPGLYVQGHGEGCLQPHSPDSHRRCHLSALSLEFILGHAIRKAEAQLPQTGSCPGTVPLAATGSWVRSSLNWHRPQPFVLTMAKFQKQPG